MSTASSQPSRCVSATSEAEQVVEYLLHEPGLCGWCLSKVRRYHEQFDEDRKRQIDNQRSVLPVITATSDAEPAAFQEIVPPKKDCDRPWVVTEPARSKTICSECCEVDIDWEMARPRNVMLLGIENIVDQLENGEVIIGEWSLNKGRARRKVKELRSHPDFANRDKEVWAIAIDAALEEAPDLQY